MTPVALKIEPVSVPAGAVVDQTPVVPVGFKVISELRSTISLPLHSVSLAMVAKGHVQSLTLMLSVIVLLVQGAVAPEVVYWKVSKPGVIPVASKTGKPDTAVPAVCIQVPGEAPATNTVSRFIDVGPCGAVALHSILSPFLTAFGASLTVIKCCPEEGQAPILADVCQLRL